MAYYKFLQNIDSKIKSANGDHTWEVGVTYSIPDNIELVPCSVGFHASPTPFDALGYVKGNVLAIVDNFHNDMQVSATKINSRTMRIVKAVEWTAQDSVELAVYSAELVLGIFEQRFPNDDRPRKAIEAAKNNVSRAYAAADAADAAGIKAQINQWIIDRKFPS